MLDETLRRRVVEIAAADPVRLDDAARERIVRRVVSEGPGIVRRARRARFALMAAGPTLAVAAAAAVLLRHPVDKGREGDAVPARAVAASVCAGRVAPVGATFVAASDGVSSELDLGAVAIAVAEPGAEVRVADVAPCRTVIALDKGRVTVHAKDLGGGELTVHARDGEVTVHGTIFAVTQSTDSLVVEVAEGRVRVKDRAGDHWVSAGERLLVSAVGVAQGSLAPERAKALRGAVGALAVVGLETLEAVPEQAAVAGHAVHTATEGVASQRAPARAEAPTAEAVDLGSSEKPEAKPVPRAAGSSDLLAKADEARHSGDYASARDLYRRAAVGQGPTAEAAWVALARMELSLGHAALAREATKQRQDHFGQGTLAPEALWIDVRTYRQGGDPARARTLSEELVRRWPSSPQARAAEQWLSGD